MATIAVYGSSLVKPGEADYESAYGVGKALAQSGHTVMTGGYAGVMEAASKGAAEVGGHVIGVTTAQLLSFRGAQVNTWVDEEIHYPTLRERMMHLILEADGYVVMPGGLGTLNELVTAWEMLRVGDLPPRPMILYGDYWSDLLEPMRTLPYFKPESWSLLQIATTPDEVVEGINHE